METYVAELARDWFPGQSLGDFGYDQQKSLSCYKTRHLVLSIANPNSFAR